MSVFVANARPLRRRRRHPFGLLSLGLVALMMVAAALLGGRALLVRGDAMPGVRVLDAEVGGLSAEQVSDRVRAATARRLAAPVVLTVGDRGVRIRPKLLFTLDRAATSAAVLSARRESWSERGRALLSPLTPSVEVEPALTARPEAERRLTELLGRFGRAPVSARVVMQGTEPTVAPGRAGTQPALAPLLAALERRVVAGTGTVPVSFGPAAPLVSDAAARVVADRARALVSQPVALRYEGQPAGALEPSTLAGLVRFRASGPSLAVFLDSEGLARALEPAVAAWRREPVDARIESDGSRAWVVPAQSGTALDTATSVLSATTAAHARNDRTAELRLATVPADFTTAEANAMGIREPISSFTTEMGVSSSNRIHNVHLMADYIDGTVIAPGETFSFNESVGPRTPERGFREGQMIVGSLLLPSIGGGVCQTATTLFNNAFELGLPIAERHNHSFYISHYPMGRDATVSWGGPDFSFRNDMEHGLMIKSSYTNSTLTFTFLGTDEGREVSSSTGSQTNFRSPELSYALDPAAPEGSMRVERGSHQQGFDVTVFRTVTKSGATIRNDSFTSSYVAVGDTAIYGPGRTIPGSYFVLPTT